MCHQKYKDDHQITMCASASVTHWGHQRCVKQEEELGEAESVRDQLDYSKR